jgi:hypothetical protein
VRSCHLHTKEWPSVAFWPPHFACATALRPPPLPKRSNHNPPLLLPLLLLLLLPLLLLLLLLSLLQDAYEPPH